MHVAKQSESYCCCRVFKYHDLQSRLWHGPCEISLNSKRSAAAGKPEKMVLSSYTEWNHIWLLIRRISSQIAPYYINSFNFADERYFDFSKHMLSSSHFPFSTATRHSNSFPIPTPLTPCINPHVPISDSPFSLCSQTPLIGISSCPLFLSPPLYCLVPIFPFCKVSISLLILSLLSSCSPLLSVWRKMSLFQYLRPAQKHRILDFNQGIGSKTDHRLLWHYGPLRTHYCYPINH